VTDLTRHTCQNEPHRTIPKCNLPNRTVPATPNRVKSRRTQSDRTPPYRACLIRPYIQHLSRPHLACRKKPNRS